MAEYRLSPPCQKCFLMLIAQKFFLHISHIFGQTLIFCAAIFPYKICLFLKVLSLGRVVDKLAKIIVVIKLLFCFFLFTWMPFISQEITKISIAFTIGVPVNYMRFLWDDIGLQELGQLII